MKYTYEMISSRYRVFSNFLVNPLFASSGFKLNGIVDFLLAAHSFDDGGQDYYARIENQMIKFLHKYRIHLLLYCWMYKCFEQYRFRKLFIPK